MHIYIHLFVVVIYNTSNYCPLTLLSSPPFVICPMQQGTALCVARLPVAEHLFPKDRGATDTLAASTIPVSMVHMWTG